MNKCHECLTNKPPSIHTVIMFRSRMFKMPSKSGTCNVTNWLITQNSCVGIIRQSTQELYIKIEEKQSFCIISCHRYEPSLLVISSFLKSYLLTEAALLLCHIPCFRLESACISPSTETVNVSYTTDGRINHQKNENPHKLYSLYPSRVR